MSFEPFNGMTPPNEWKAKLVKDIAVVNERAIKKSDCIDTIQYIDIAAVNHRNIDQLQKFNLNDAPSRARRIVQDNDILISTVRPNLKHYTMIRKAEPNMIASTGFAVISPKKVHPDFLYYYLTSDSYTRYLTQIAEGQTSAYPAFNPDIIEYTMVYLPSDNEQREIGEMLASIDKKIELNNAIIKNLEDMAQALFKRWFVDFEFPDDNGEPYKSSGGEFEESELGLIPKGWKVCTLGEFCEISTISINPATQPDIIFEHYSLPAFDSGKLPVFEFGCEIKSNKYKVSKNSILVSKLNPETKRIWSPYCLTDYAICSTEFVNYIPVNSKLRAYCFSILNSEGFHQYLVGNTTGSTNSRQRVNPKGTLHYKLAYGGSDTAYIFNDLVSGIYKKINENTLENKYLASIRDTLLPKLMSGEIRVPVEQDHSAPNLPMVAESKAIYQT
ncbi:restriction endonuclease subunit S [Effusibacillus consociatus]|uniref:Restriction endonuclease subunit S n=1 Tax=Effusibacillus consociatus TaxID=1117041 RepID=A0ABV9PVS0_9BACL